MKIRFLSLLLPVMISAALISCKTDDSVEPDIDLASEFDSLRFKVGENSKTVTFTASHPWSVAVSSTTAGNEPVSWLSVSPESGDAGDTEVVITAKENYTREGRKAYIRLEIEGLSKSITVTKDASITVEPDDNTPVKIESKGVYVMNSDWFSHDDASVNYSRKNGSGYDIVYRAYRLANQDDKLGHTGKFGAVWGDHTYLLSAKGNRFVVAQNGSLKKKAVFTDLADNSGDPVTFTGVTDTKVYVGHTKGIAVFDTETMRFGRNIDKIGFEVGAMHTAGNRVFALTSNVLYVINAEADAMETGFRGDYCAMTRSKDGNIWVATAENFIVYNPLTLETREVAYPAGSQVGSQWSWGSVGSAGSLCASTQNNVIYWTSGARIVKYDIDSETFDTAFYTLGKSHYGNQLTFYGAGLRVDPLTDELVLTLMHDGGGYSYNFLYILDSRGGEVYKTEVLGDNGLAKDYEPEGGYFWFPYLQFFEDANKPHIILNQILLKPGETVAVDLCEKVVDYDNSLSCMYKKVEYADDGVASLELDGDKLNVTAGKEPGSASFVLTVISNGVRVDKQIKIDIEEP